MKEKLLKLLVGKNLPHLARVACTALGAWLLTGALFSPETVALDPSLGAAVEAIGAPSVAQVEDGLNVGELVAAIGGALLIWVSRLLSWLRAKNYDWLANIIGPLIGRSLPSLLRAGMTSLAVVLARFAVEPGVAPEALADKPLASVLGAVAIVLFNNFLSATEDAKRNPVAPVLDAPKATRPTFLDDL